MLKWKIVKKEFLVKQNERITFLTNEREVLMGEKIVLRGIIDDCEKTQKEKDEKHELQIQKLRETYEQEIKKEQEKHARYLAKQKDKSIQAKKKWLNGYPDEEFKG